MAGALMMKFVARSEFKTWRMMATPVRMAMLAISNTHGAAIPPPEVSRRVLTPRCEKDAIGNTYKIAVATIRAVIARRACPWHPFLARSAAMTTAGAITIMIGYQL